MKRVVTMLTGITIFALGGLSLAGYAAGAVRMYAWGGKSAPGMGLNTALAFVLCGVAFVVCSFRKDL